ncbi:MAG: PAS domain S-box protein [Deltaproteobacteria bacterium]|nr:PAS domain S-box protein [Deltaproteobacteria bacterium]
MKEPQILLLDDRGTWEGAVLSALSSAGFQVFAGQGEPAEAVARHQPECVVLSTSVPLSTLAQLVTACRSAARMDISVVALLERDDADAVPAAMAAGVDEFAFLPAREDEVVARVRTCLGRRAAVSEIERHRRDAAALLELSQTLSSSLQIPLILHAASRLMAKIIDVERCAIVLLDKDRNEGVIVAVSEDRSVRDLRIALPKYPEIMRVIETGAPLVVADLSADPLLRTVRETSPELTGTAILFPILIEERVQGAFFLRSRQVRRSPDDHEMQFGQTVANATGVAIRNARMFEGARASNERMTREREHTEERLRNLQKFEQFFEEAADGMVILDRDGVVLYSNLEGAAQLGLARDELSGRRLADKLAPDSAGLLATVVAEVMRGRFRRTFDLYAVRDDGFERCLACSAGAVADPDGGRVCMISFRDVTELREMQMELKTTKEFLENLIDSSVDAIIAADIHGHVMLFNKGAERVYGYRADEVIGKLHVSALYPEGVATEIMEQLRSEQHGGRGKLEAMRKAIVVKGGDQVPVSLTASIVYEGGEEVATVGIFTDLRERIKIEDKLSAAQERLLETERATVVAQLAGAAAHELNQPLTSILGYAEMLKRKVAEADPMRRSVDIIFREGERMADIVRKIGSITRFETKNYVGNTRIVDLNRSQGDGPDAPLPPVSVPPTPVAAAAAALFKPPPPPPGPRPVIDPASLPPALRPPAPAAPSGAVTDPGRPARPPDKDGNA